MPEQIEILGKTRLELRDILVDLGEASFRGEQIFKWIHQHGCLDFHQMTDLPERLRANLSQFLTISVAPCELVSRSADQSAKLLFRASQAENAAVEAVQIPEPTRMTLCVSSQIGCALKCSFCATGLQGWTGDLTSAEIMSQLWHTVHIDKQRVSNLVFMGMGEPLLNTEAVLNSARIMLDDHAYGLSKHRVTISTSGVLPAIENDLDPELGCSLALSLHAVDHDLRNELVPLNKKYPFDLVLPACKEYLAKAGTGRQLFVEWILLDGVNDSVSQAKDLVKALSGIPAKVNLMPFNPVDSIDYKAPSNDRQTQFYETIKASGIQVMHRKQRGDDVNAACGQLSGRVGRRMKQSSKSQSQIAIENIPELAIDTSA